MLILDRLATSCPKARRRFARQVTDKWRAFQM